MRYCAEGGANRGEILLVEGALLLQTGATNPSGGRQRSLVLAKITREEDC